MSGVSGVQGVSGVSGAGGMRGVNGVSLPFSPHDPPPRAATTLGIARLPALHPIADGVVVVGAGLSGVVRGRGNSSGLVTVLALVRRGLQGYTDGMLTSVGVGVETGGDGLGLGVATGTGCRRRWWLEARLCEWGEWLVVSVSVSWQRCEDNAGGVEELAALV